MARNVIGAFEAKTHLSALLERVQQGEQIVITRHGRPVARLMPPVSDTNVEPMDVLGRIRSLRTGHALGMDWTLLRNERRR